MMDVNPASALAPPPLAGPIQQTEAEELKTDFLRLLIAQLQAQDPLNPQDASDFTAQLAQFSSLEQLVQMNQGIAAQNELAAISIGTAAVSFVGQQAEIAGDRITVAGGEPGESRFALAVASQQTTVNIYEESGRLIRTMSLGPMAEGSHDIEWDGLTRSGAPAADGTYRIEVLASDADGNPLSTRTSIVGTISGVRFEDGLVLLQMDGRFFTLGDLIEVGLAAPDNPNPNPLNPDDAPQEDQLA